jgi:integrase/recombinase XerD
MTGSSIVNLDQALVEYGRYLDKRPISDNTRKAFWGDANLFLRHMTQDDKAAPVVSRITADNVREFMAVQEKRKDASSPKSLERRLTSVKVFFRFLRDRGWIAADPSDSIAYRPIVDPMPDHLTEAQAEAVLQAARDHAAGEKMDTRPLAIIWLVLETGIKKSECLALTTDHLSRSPRMVNVRYAQKHLQFKEREIAISADCLAAVDAHLARYDVTSGRLFDCTGRNIEYIFNGKIAPKAGLSALTFEMLRWTCALRDYRAGTMDDALLQYKYGLSAIGWAEMSAKLERVLKSEG